MPSSEAVQITVEKKNQSHSLLTDKLKTDIKSWSREKLRNSNLDECDEPRGDDHLWYSSSGGGEQTICCSHWNNPRRPILPWNGRPPHAATTQMAGHQWEQLLVIILK